MTRKESEARHKQRLKDTLLYLEHHAEMLRNNHTGRLLRTEEEWIALKFSCSRTEAEDLIREARRGGERPKISVAAALNNAGIVSLDKDSELADLRAVNAELLAVAKETAFFLEQNDAVDRPGSLLAKARAAIARAEQKGTTNV